MVYKREWCRQHFLMFLCFGTISDLEWDRLWFGLEGFVPSPVGGSEVASSAGHMVLGCYCETDGIRNVVYLRAWIGMGWKHMVWFFCAYFLVSWRRVACVGAGRKAPRQNAVKQEPQRVGRCNQYVIIKTTQKIFCLHTKLFGYII